MTVSRERQMSTEVHVDAKSSREDEYQKIAEEVSLQNLRISTAF